MPMYPEVPPEGPGGWLPSLIDRVTLAITCPRCKAGFGRRCVKRGGSPANYPHWGRTRLARATVTGAPVGEE